MHPSLIPGNVAVITGAGVGGIGYATAVLLATRYQLRVVLADISASALTAAHDGLIAAGVAESDIVARETDVSSFEDMKALADVAYEAYGHVDFLFLNAGTGGPSKDFAPGGDMEAWSKTLSVNLFGVLNGTQAFVDKMVQQGTSGAVVITGSKQGITQPPGNPAYNVSKSAVKSLAESLAHSLISTSLTAHLLVPGYTATKLTNGGDIPSLDKKPAAAWTADEVAEELFSRIENEFYIICPDNDVTWELDAARIEWNANDILQKRPALSRWHPDHKDAFAKFVEEKVKK
ncbi:hypothetical protein P7C70_g239, partial [Phenoliferia sp. Uapishka_3]